VLPAPAFEIRLDRRTAQAADVTEPADLPQILEALDLQSSRPALAVVGGADGLNTAAAERLRHLFLEALVPLADELDAAVVSGGTDAGVMRLLGHSRDALQASFDLVGVAAVGTVQVPGRPQAGEELARLEPHHTHFVLVPGDTWGAESPWLAKVTTWLAGGARSATVVINGGRLTYDDVRHSLTAGRPVLVAAGTGRTADQLAAAIRGEDADEPAAALAASAPKLLRAVDVMSPSQEPALVAALRDALC
jgi:hypothetical protein